MKLIWTAIIARFVITNAKVWKYVFSVQRPCRILCVHLKFDSAMEFFGIFIALWLNNVIRHNAVNAFKWENYLEIVWIRRICSALHMNFNTHYVDCSVQVNYLFITSITDYNLQLKYFQFNKRVNFAFVFQIWISDTHHIKKNIQNEFWTWHWNCLRKRTR